MSVKRSHQSLQPAPVLPPTPDSTPLLTHFPGFVSNDQSFALPPPALPTPPTPPSAAVKRRRTSSTTSASTVPSLLSSPTTTITSQLPPPPTRSRKIIQMKPPSPSTATPAPPKKVSRKTAHSIIERRRRGRMNEEFAVLKDLVPACRGVEMHKLAILQAGIEYVRYLEACVEELRSNQQFVSPPQQQFEPTQQSSRETSCGSIEGSEDAAGSALLRLADDWLREEKPSEQECRRISVNELLT